ncbi:peptidoglycan-binding protein [Streptomyces inusitatus]|nr:peptidoglycan-binding protein [Streptomyces inusitatus]
MSVPVFEEYEPAPDCGCPGCFPRPRALPSGGRPAAHGRRGALVLLTAAGVVLGGAAGPVHAVTAPPVAPGPATAPASAPDPGPASAPVTAPLPSPAPAAELPAVPSPAPSPVPSSSAPPAVPPAAPLPDPPVEPVPAVPAPAVPVPAVPAPVPGPAAEPVPAPPMPVRATTRAEIIARAKEWLAAKVPYSMKTYWSDGYRQDCSGFVSMAWGLARNEWTGTLAQYGTRIAREELRPGDILLFHNPVAPNEDSHVTIFGGWSDDARTSYLAYEQTRPHTRRQSTPMAYWSDSDQYVAYRRLELTDTDTDTGALTAGTPAADAYPGESAFGPGANNAHVTRLGRMLLARGGARFYTEGPGPVWGEADRRATEAFQWAQGWSGGDADGEPGPETWRLLVTGEGQDIPPEPVAAEPTAPAPAPVPVPAPVPDPAAADAVDAKARAAVPPYPGRGHFRPGRSGAPVDRLGRRLVQRGFGRHYTSGPGPVWTEEDRRNVEAFQRAQGWRGPAADGYPGPETWRRLFGGPASASAPAPAPAAVAGAGAASAETVAVTRQKRREQS